MAAGPRGWPWTRNLPQKPPRKRSHPRNRVKRFSPAAPTRDRRCCDVRGPIKTLGPKNLLRPRKQRLRDSRLLRRRLRHNRNPRHLPQRRTALQDDPRFAGQTMTQHRLQLRRQLRNRRPVGRRTTMTPTGLCFANRALRRRTRARPPREAVTLPLPVALLLTRMILIALS